MDLFKLFPKLVQSSNGEQNSLELLISNTLNGFNHNIICLDQSLKIVSNGFAKRSKNEKLEGFQLKMSFARIGRPKSLDASIEVPIEKVAQISAGYEKTSVKDFVQHPKNQGGLFFERTDIYKDGRVSLEDIEFTMSAIKQTGEHAHELIGHCRTHSAATLASSQSSDSLARDVLKSALAGGIACSFSAFVMHPVDTIKTHLQASTLSFPELISRIPDFGLRGTYKGSIPAVLGQFTSHGLRTGLHQVSKYILLNAAPGLPEVQVQSLASFCSTVIGTVYRVPFEVLKQRLQAGIFDNVGEAAVITWQQDGLQGFFRGTGATLCRELPFYVFGAGLYRESKKAGIFDNVGEAAVITWQQDGLQGFFRGTGATLCRELPFYVFGAGLYRESKKAGIFDNVGEAAVITWQQDGLQGFFRGTGATLCRELPFYVFGAGLYRESKKAGIFDNVGEAAVITWQQDGLQGFFRGTGATLCRELPFYVFGAGLYRESKKAGIFDNVGEAAVITWQQDGLQGFFRGTGATLCRELPFYVFGAGLYRESKKAGIFDNVGEAAVITWQQDGLQGFFRGTGATLCRELPFYVFGAGLYRESKKAMEKIIKRELEPWETVVVGAITGGFASVLTTPFDVIKTRMMTAPQGMQVTMQIAALTILHEEGPFALFRGAVPRFFWVAPLGAMNFAGYELIRKAMDSI